MDQIRKYDENNKIWVIIDESTDIDRWYVGNVVIKSLEVNKPGITFLLNSKILEKTKHSTDVQLFDNSLLLLWPKGIKRENILLFISDVLYDRNWKTIKM